LASTAPGVNLGVISSVVMRAYGEKSLILLFRRVCLRVDRSLAGRVALAAATAGWLLAAPSPAMAQANIVDEVKLGVLGHDLGFLGHHLEAGPDVNLEMLFTPPDVLAIIGSPRPHIGADINTAGKTSDGYFGLTWGIMVIQSLFGAGDGVFINGSLGGAVHDGYIDSGPLNRKLLGSRVLFRESAELGYQLTPGINVSALLDHISNANLGRHNMGITSAGARFGFKF
jgi:lipid A 3-O-deacylase